MNTLRVLGGQWKLGGAVVPLNHPVVRCFSTLPPPSVLLNTLKDNPGATKQRKRVGRGPGSGRGKTAGRGQKGQKSRSGSHIRIGFEGGQTPLYRRLPKRGFNNKFATPLETLTLSKLQLWIDMGRINPTEKITLKQLQDSGIVGSIKHGVKLLSGGPSGLVTPVDIEVSRASDSAIQAIEEVGGRVRSVYYSRLALRAHLKPEKFERIPESPKPPPRLMPFYTNWEKRGFLSSEAQLADLLAAREDASGKSTPEEPAPTAE